MLGFPVLTRRTSGVAICRQVQKAALALTIEKVRVGKCPKITPNWTGNLFRLFVEGEEPLGLGIRQRLEQHTVDDGEHDGGRSGAEGECQQDDSRKSRLLPQSAKCIAEILPQVLQPACAAGIPAVFFHLLGAA